MECGPEAETFSEGLHFLHNPWAEVTLASGALPQTTRHELLDDGRVLTTSSRLDPFVSITRTFYGPLARAYGQAMVERFMASNA